MRTSALIVATLIVTCSLLVAVPTARAAGPRGPGVDVNGPTISSDIWYKNLSPYRVHANITVIPSGTLTIEAGVEVLFDGNTSLTVDSGTLHIMGVANDRVLFNANTTTPYAGYYGFIRINGSSPTLTADYANFSHGIKGFYIEGNGSAQTMQINNCRFINNQEAGIYGTSLVGMTVYDSKFNDSSGYGIHLENSNNCTVSNTTFYNNSWVNIALSDSQHISIQSCDMMYGFESVALYMTRGILMNKGNISNADTGVRMTLSTDTTVDNFHFIANNRGIILNDSTNSILRSNNFDGSGDGILFEGGPNYQGTSIDTTNFLGVNPIHFITGNQSLGGVSAGEVLVAGGRDSEIRDINMSQGGHVQFFRSSNCTVSNITLDSPVHGFQVVSSESCNVKACTVLNAKESGFSSYNSSSVEFSAGRMQGCRVGMDVLNTQNSNANFTSFISNQEDIVVSSSALHLFNSPINISTVQADSNVTESFTLMVAVQNPQSFPMQGADVSVTQPDLYSTVYSTAHFGGTDAKTDSEGRMGPVKVTTYLHSNGVRKTAPTIIDVWNSTDTFGGSRNITMTNASLVTFTAQAAGSLSGTVKDLTGVAIAGATVTLNSVINSTANSTGGYLFLQLAPGMYNINVSATGYTGATASGVSVTGGNMTVKDFVLTPTTAAPGSINGTVRDGAGAPLKGVIVTIPSLSIEVSTDINGNFSITNVSAGNYPLKAILSGYDGWGGNVPVLSGEVTRLNITLNITPFGNQTGTISGTVRSASGQPISGASISLDGSNRSVRSGADGSYALVNITPGRYDLRATCPGFADSNVPNITVTSGGNTKLDIMLTKTDIFHNESLGVSCIASFKDNGTLEISAAGAKDRALGGGIGVYFRIDKGNGSKLEWVNITVKYDRSKLPSGVNESNLKLYWYDKDLKLWKACDNTGVDMGRGIVWANMSHLTLFGIGGGAGPKGAGATIALAGGITPLAFVAVVLIVGVPIGILVIRIRTPPPTRKQAVPQMRQEEPEGPF